jgi:hypothetical protein
VRVTAYRTFYVFCALLFPLIAVGATFITYRVHPLFGALTATLLIAWVWHSFSTTCSRCQFYGTSKCGIPGLVVPYFFKKRSAAGLPLWRIWANYYSDIALMFYINAVYLWQPTFLPITLGATAIVWFVIYRRKRFHGLMHLLKKRDRTIPIAAI